MLCGWVIRCKHRVIPVPMLARRRHEIGEPVQELKRREFDDAVRPGRVDFRERPGPTQLAAEMVTQRRGTHVANFGCATAYDQPSSSRSARSLSRPAARFAFRISSSPSTGATTSPKVAMIRFGHAASNSSPVTLVMMSMRLGGTPI